MFSIFAKYSLGVYPHNDIVQLEQINFEVLHISKFSLAADQASGKGSSAMLKDMPSSLCSTT